MKKMNNKGFSLVELIIVIAIMAILIAVLAPQYIKYVEKSRQSADLDNYRAIVDAIQVAYGDVDSPLADGATVTVANTGVTFGGAEAANLPTELAKVGVKLDGIKTKSTKYGGATLTVNYDATNGLITITVDSSHPDLASELGLSAS